MNEREIAKYMRDRGFKELRPSRHGMIWTDGHSTVLTNRHLNPGYAQKNMEREVAKAVSHRPRPESIDALKEHFRRVDMKVQKPAVQTQATPEKEDPMFARESDHRPPAQKPPVVQGLSQSDAKAPEPTPKTTAHEPRFRKYTIEQRFRVDERVQQLTEAGLHAEQVAEQMAREGFLTPDAKSPITAHYVYQTKTRLRELGKLKQRNSAVNTAVELPKGYTVDTQALVPIPPVQTTVRITKLPDAVLNILTDPDLSDVQKIRMITAWAGV